MRFIKKFCSILSPFLISLQCLLMFFYFEIMLSDNVIRLQQITSSLTTVLPLSFYITFLALLKKNNHLTFDKLISLETFQILTSSTAQGYQEQEATITIQTKNNTIIINKIDCGVFAVASVEWISATSGKEAFFEEMLVAFEEHLLMAYNLKNLTFLWFYSCSLKEVV